MDGQPIPENTLDAVEDALTSAVGMHGPWVLAIETYDEQGEPRLNVMRDRASTAWASLGIARALLLDLEVPFRQEDQ